MTSAWDTFEMRSSWINTASWLLKSRNPTREVFSSPLFSITPASKVAPVHFLLLSQYFCNSLFDKKSEGTQKYFLTLPKSCLERCSLAFLHQQKHHNIWEFVACFSLFCQWLRSPGIQVHLSWTHVQWAKWTTFVNMWLIVICSEGIGFKLS